MEMYNTRHIDPRKKKWGDVVNVTVKIEEVGKSKVLSVYCQLNEKAKSFVKNVEVWIVWWRARSGEKFKMIGGAKIGDEEEIGSYNVRFQPRRYFKDKVQPYMMCAVENQGGLSDISGSVTDWLEIFFILDQCDSPGQFRCQALAKVYNKNKDQPLSGELAADKVKGGWAGKYCLSQKKTNKYKEEERKYLQNFDPLPDIYMSSVRESFFKQDYFSSDMNKVLTEGSNTIMNATFRQRDGLKFMDLNCKVDVKKLEKDVRKVYEFYIFYVPFPKWPNARVMLAAFVAGKSLYVKSYRIRMFPQFKRFLDVTKKRYWKGKEGPGTSAYFEISIPLDMCDTLTGAFQCQAKIVASGIKEDATFTMVIGWYQIKHRLFVTKDEECKEDTKDTSAIMEPKREDGEKPNIGAIAGTVCGVMAAVLAFAGFIALRLKMMKKEKEIREGEVGLRTGQGRFSGRGRGRGQGRGRGRGRGRSQSRGRGQESGRGRGRGSGEEKVTMKSQ
ncbi:uncharacterized protein LOC134279257 [Saccostrea cucullata]|uniref:uncharacterized protein LOC134279257 n=1 Tax=Saccostrea cuccullata TaxID=36930 RepID=UPI002ED1B61C